MRAVSMGAHQARNCFLMFLFLARQLGSAIEVVEVNRVINVK